MLELPILKRLTQELGREVTARSSTGLGEPEEQLRGPLESFLKGVATSININQLVLVGEAALNDIKVRPDYAVLVDGVLVGHLEVKAPGKGGDPTRFRDAHDRKQWERLSTLPNLIYTDGNQWGLYRNGEEQLLLNLDGVVDRDGDAFTVTDIGLADLLSTFLGWKPSPPRSPGQLADTAARLCRLLRSEVEELLPSSLGLASLKADWANLLYPGSSDAEFADQYAQTITFGLLLARVEQIDFTAAIDADGRLDLQPISTELRHQHGLVGTALGVLTSTAVVDELASSVRTLVRVLSVVDWEALSKGDTDKWLLFYEEFLDVYDNELRKASGSYYTPNEVVGSMVRLVDEIVTHRLERPDGLVDSSVTVVDPACGTGTFLVQILDLITRRTRKMEGPGAVGPRLRESVERLIGFELQTGPFSVAEFRLADELSRRRAKSAIKNLRLFVTDTLDDPFSEGAQLGSLYEQIAKSRRGANKVKASEQVLVVIGNPPYKERAKGRGSWVEAGSHAYPAPLKDFFPDPELGLGVHSKHLYNLYVYFWRWATWKVFDQGDHNKDATGVVAFITVSGFLNGPGFAGMRSYLRRKADEIWIINTSPEGHRPDVPSRVFPGVQHPICITLAVRTGQGDEMTPANVYYRSLAPGRREQKYDELSTVSIRNEGWELVPKDWASPFAPAESSEWLSFPAILDLMPWHGSGTMPGRTWVVGPDRSALRNRWELLVDEQDPDSKSGLLKPHPRDRTIDTVQRDNLWGFEVNNKSLREESNSAVEPVRYGVRTLDRQWVIPDKRVINQPNPSLWYVAGPTQVYLTLPDTEVPSGGPAVSAPGLVPDIHHYSGRGGRAVPLWRDPEGSEANIAPGLLHYMSKVLGVDVVPEDLPAYVMAVCASPAFHRAFLADIETPGIRLPITSDVSRWNKALEIGRRLLWLHTFGERYVDAESGRPPGAPRLRAKPPKVLEPIGGEGVNSMPGDMAYDRTRKKLIIGTGEIVPVEESVYDYEVSGRRVLKHWFNYRKRDPEGKKTSPLDDVHPTEWPAAFTTELLELINVISLIVELEDQQEALLGEILAGPLVTVDDLVAHSVVPVPAESRKKPVVPPRDQLRT